VTPRLCLIPARGGSKRLPGKNIHPFFGHPLLAYTISAARRSGLFSDVIVSTDDESIGKVALHYGAEYLVRPAELASDKAGLVEVAEHALATLKARSRTVETFCQLMPNCPLRRSDDIVRHHHEFESAARQFQISVVPYRGVYAHWAQSVDEHGRGRWAFGEQFLVQSQQLGELVCPTGAIWWARTADFLAQRKFYGEPYHVALMDPIRGLDVDHREELELADVLVRGLRDRDGVTPLEPVSEKPFEGDRG
jgi:CMP-N-acetylneuraminic acid synthetase